MLRQTQDLTVPIERPSDLASLPAQRVAVALRPDGRVRARVRGAEVPPVFVGRVEESSDGATLQGVVRESAGALCLPLLFAVPALVAAALLVWAVVSGSLVTAAVAGMSVVVLSLAARAVRTLVRAAFAAHARHLSGVLADASAAPGPASA